MCATPTTITPELIAHEFRRLPLSPSPLLVQPDRGWVLLNLPTTTHTTTTPQTLTTTILDTTVTITATPTTYTWDYGDGATLSTTDPGQPWPLGTITHPYTHPGTYQITLTTTWHATYTLADDPTTRDVPGTATTTTTTPPITATQRRNHLVTTTCTTTPTPPNC